MAHVRVLGGSDWLPVAGNDGASYIFGDHLMVDLGWGAPVRLLMNGESLQQYTTLLFTHMHADHIMALPQLLLDWRIKKCTGEGLTIAGPCETLKECYERASIYAFEGKLNGELKQPPQLLELKEYDSFETEEFVIKAAPSLHAAKGRVYVLTEKATGKRIGLSGDTAYQDFYGGFFKDCDLLIHECSFGTTPVNEKNNAVCKHSSVYEAVRVAKEAGVKRLMLTHTKGNKEDCLALARSLTDIPVEWAQTGVETDV